MITHKNMLYNLYQSKAWRSDLLEDVDIIVAITALPLYHIFSLQSNCLAMMLDGGENILITNPRDFPAFVKEPLSALTEKPPLEPALRLNVIE